MALNDEIGVVCWFSLMTTDLKRSCDFYAELANYEITEYEMPGVGKAQIFNSHQKGFAGPVALDESAGIPSHWITYYTVADVDESTKRVEKLGGKVCIEPFDMPGIGRTSVINDPSGAVFHLFTPFEKEQDINVMGGKPGQICWVELMVEDVEPVIQFYKELLNWHIEKLNMSDTEDYFTCKVGEVEVAGIMKKPADLPKMPPHWLPFVSVENIQTSSEKAENLGAEALLGPQEVPNIGVFTLLKDPTGAIFYLFENY